MHPIFLTSSVHAVAGHIGTKLKAKHKHLKLLFIDTAAEAESGDKVWLANERQSLVDAGFNVTDFTLTNKQQSQVKSVIEPTDVIYASGGNTYYLLSHMRQSGFFNLIHDYVPQHKVYIGTSAGSIVAGPNIEILALGDDPSSVPQLKDYTGLGLTDISVLPHWGSSLFKRDMDKVMRVMYVPQHKYVLLNDYQYLEVQGTDFKFVDVRKA